MARTVREVMTRSPVCLSPQTTLTEASHAMAEQGIGDVLVLDGDLRGVVTDRDIVVRALANNRDPASTTLAEILSGDVVAVAPDDPVSRAVQLMRERAIRRLPVCEGDQPVGIVSIGDLAVEQDPSSALADISAAAPNP